MSTRGNRSGLGGEVCTSGRLLDVLEKQVWHHPLIGTKKRVEEGGRKKGEWRHIGKTRAATMGENICKDRRGDKSGGGRPCIDAEKKLRVFDGKPRGV